MIVPVSLRSAHPVRVATRSDHETAVRVRMTKATRAPVTAPAMGRASPHRDLTSPVPVHALDPSRIGDERRRPQWRPRRPMGQPGVRHLLRAPPSRVVAARASSAVVAVVVEAHRVSVAISLRVSAVSAERSASRSPAWPRAV